MSTPPIMLPSVNPSDKCSDKRRNVAQHLSILSTDSGLVLEPSKQNPKKCSFHLKFPLLQKVAKTVVRYYENHDLLLAVVAVGVGPATIAVVDEAGGGHPEGLQNVDISAKTFLGRVADRERLSSRSWPSHTEEALFHLKSTQN
jgi:hypothetical protein